MSGRRYSLVRNDGTIWIDGRIGPDDVSAAALRRSLVELEDRSEIGLTIDTPGGDLDEGLACYVALRESDKAIDVTVRRAFSMGAIIAMAGRTIRIARDGAFFLHGIGRERERFIASGMAPHMTAAGLRTMARDLDRRDAVLLDILHRRTRIDRQTLAGMLVGDTTLDAVEAVRLGFADEVIRHG